MTTIPTEPIWIDSDSELASLCDRWQAQGAVAVDTEFMRSETFYPIAGLLQVGDGAGCYLIDPLSIRDLQPLRALFQNPGVTKVLHACSEDLEVFQRWLGVLPEPLFDTQVAAAFAGYGFSIGYAGLVREILDVEVPKGETRSDWLQRPLSVAQQKYAALDVAHMLVVYGKLLQTLRASERLEWVKADCADLIGNARATPEPQSYYLKVGSAWKLKPQQLAVLRSLCAWREREARERDRPRNRLIKDAGLWELARVQPQRAEQFRSLKEVPARVAAQEGDTFLKLIAEARALPQNEWPESLPPPIGKAEMPLMKTLKRYVRERAEGLVLPPELLVRKREYEAIVRSGAEGGPYQLPERLKGWRFQLVGEGLLATAEAQRQRPVTGGQEGETP